jgi:hypothetical protein
VRDELRAYLGQFANQELHRLEDPPNRLRSCDLLITLKTLH